jgi:hypothetical protein
VDQHGSVEGSIIRNLAILMSASPWRLELLTVAEDVEGHYGAAGGANLPEKSIACAASFTMS